MVNTFIYVAVSSYLQLLQQLKQLSETSRARFRLLQRRSEACKVLDWSSGRLQPDAGHVQPVAAILPSFGSLCF